MNVLLLFSTRRNEVRREEGRSVVVACPSRSLRRRRRQRCSCNVDQSRNVSKDLKDQVVPLLLVHHPNGKVVEWFHCCRDDPDLDPIARVELRHSAKSDARRELWRLLVEDPAPW